jgi:cardiolipin synthase
MTGFWTALVIAASWTVRLVMVPIVVTRKRDPIACIAWLMCVFFQPWIGLGAYLLIGENRLGRKRLLQRSDAFGEYTAARPPEVPAVDLVNPDQFAANSILVSLGERVGGLPIVVGNSVRLFANTQYVIDRLLQDIPRPRITFICSSI